MPIVRMAESEVKLAVGGRKAAKLAKSQPSSSSQQQQLLARLWNDYGIGLLEQMQYGAAADAFRRAVELNPQDSDLLVNASIAELRTEQYGLERGQIRKAEQLLDRALKLNPSDARARFFHALVLRADKQPRASAEELSKIASEYPRDREVWRQLGQTLYLLGDIAGAQTAFESIIRIDPNDAGAYQFLSPIYASEGLKDESARAQSLYLLWRDDPLAESVAARFFAANPQWAEERVWSHVHASDSPQRPTLTGQFAAPER